MSNTIEFNSDLKGAVNHQLFDSEADTRQTTYKCAKVECTFETATKKALLQHVWQIHSTRKYFICFKRGCEYNAFEMIDLIGHLHTHPIHCEFQCNLSANCDFCTRDRNLMAKHVIDLHIIDLLLSN